MPECAVCACWDSGFRLPASGRATVCARATASSSVYRAGLHRLDAPAGCPGWMPQSTKHEVTGPSSFCFVCIESSNKRPIDRPKRPPAKIPNPNPDSLALYTSAASTRSTLPRFLSATNTQAHREVVALLGQRRILLVGLLPSPSSMIVYNLPVPPPTSLSVPLY
jgi:hypothetical protein